MMCVDDDDDEWTEVSTTQLQQHTDPDAAIADTTLGYVTQASTRLEVQSDLDVTVKPSLDNPQNPNVASSLAAVATSSVSCTDDAQIPTTAVTETPADHPASLASTDSVGSSVSSSDHTKSDSLVVVAVTPERTSPSDESSNAKGSSFYQLLYKSG